MTGNDGQEAWYDYDNLRRLSKTWSRPTTTNTKATANVQTTYAYTYNVNNNMPKRNSVVNTTTFSAVTGSAISTIVNAQYTDGLGRLVQTVGKQQSPLLFDVVNIMEYDNQGRQSKVYNPIVSSINTGDFYATAPSGSYAFTTYEPSPLNRVASVTPPGWYATTSAYGKNIANEVTELVTGTTYAANLLFKTTMTDPDNKTTTTYKDKKGRTILSRRSDTGNTNPANTYSIYDDQDRVSQVVPPGASYNSALCFKYLYDESDNLTSKTIPDVGAVSMKYNARDQLALSYIPHLSKWMGAKYDNYGRPISAGLVTGTDPNASTFKYNELLTRNSYDGLSVTGATLYPASIYKGKPTQSEVKVMGTSNLITTTTQYDAHGRPMTVSGNNHLYTSSNTAESTTMAYDWADNLLSITRTHKPSSTATARNIVQKQTYDQRGRLLSNKFNNYLTGTGTEVTLSELNYYEDRDLLKEKNLGKTATSFLQSLDYAYNAQGWMTAVNQEALGGIIQGLPAPYTNPTPGSSPGGSLDDNDLFWLNLRYNDPQTGYGIPETVLKNGNISQVWWRTRGRNREAYGLNYDHLDRLLDANHLVVSGTTNTGTKVNNLFDEHITYADLRGNIASIKRNGAPTSSTATAIDDIVLNYANPTTSNKVTSVTENVANATNRPKGFNPGAGTGTYGYDASGNLTSDPYKGINTDKIVYNHLNLPTSITFADGKSILITYDATGQKLRKIVKQGTTVLYQQDYAGGIEYRTTPAKGLTLESIYHKEGRVFNTNVTDGSTVEALRYEYSIKDHLGNTRLTFSDIVKSDGSAGSDGRISVPGDILQENHYYPFGLSMEAVWMNNAALDTKYQYNGKELNGDGLEWMDYGGRWYDAAVGRFPIIDPISDIFFNESGYIYAGNNPINFVDIGGLYKFPQGDGPNGEYKIFNDYLKSGDIARLLSNADIRNGLKVVGDFSDTQINDLAEYRKGIEIKVVPDDQIFVGGDVGGERNGSFLNSEGDGSFLLSETLVNQFTTASASDKQAALLFVVMTILHESIHVGMNRNGSIVGEKKFGNWKRKGAVYSYKNEKVILHKAVDIRDSRLDEVTRGLTQEAGYGFERVIWKSFITKRDRWGLDEGREFIDEKKDKSTIPVAGN